MVELSDSNYERLLAARNEFGAALSALSDAADAVTAADMASTGITASELQAAAVHARNVLSKYVEHQAFLTFEAPRRRGVFRLAERLGLLRC